MCPGYNIALIFYHSSKTFIFQDDLYIYPSLDLSDDEMEIGPSVAAAKDDAWNPKVRVKNVLKKSEPRPTRDKAKKVTAIEMGLKLAAERRRTNKLAPKKKPSTSPKKSLQHQSLPKLTLHNSLTDVSASPVMNSPAGASAYLSPTPSSSMRPGMPKANMATKLATPSVSAIKKSKKGMLTAKQRIAKTLGLKF